MKTIRIIPILSLAILICPIFAFAAELSECDAGTIDCWCDPAPYVDSKKITTSDDCYNECVTLAAAGDDEITGYSLECKIGGVVTTIDQDILGSIEEAAKEVYYEDPTLSVEIPGLTFTPAYGDNGVVVTNYLGEYIQAVYNWLIPAASLLAVVMMMIGGLQWMLARGDSGKISNAKTKLKNATTGLVLLLGAYSITYIIEPGLLTYDSLRISAIDAVEYVNASQDLADPYAISHGGDAEIDINSIPGDMVCDTSYSLKDIAYSAVGDVSYRYGGKGGPPPYTADTHQCEDGPCKDYCPTGTICLDCSGFANYIRTCAGLPAAGESGGTTEIFNSSSEKISNWDGSTSINGKELVAGDMIGRPGNHVLIYIGDGEVADSHGSGRAKGQAIGIYSLDFPLKELWAGEDVYIRRRNP